MNSDEEVQLSVSITNEGKVAGEEVVQLYITDMEASVTVPLSSLKDFKRVYLEPGESREVAFTITQKMLEIVNGQGESILEPGEFKITIGGASPGPRSIELGAAQPVEVLISCK